MKKSISLFLVFSILALSGNLFAKESHGINIEIYMTKPKMEGTPFEKPDIRGELIAAKGNSLLILDSESGADITVGIEDVKVIKILKKSKVWRGAVRGLMIGGFTGGLLSSFFSDEALGALIFGSLGGLVGLLIGGITGVTARVDETIQFENKSDTEIQEILEKLRKKARIKNAQ